MRLVAVNCCIALRGCHNSSYQIPSAVKDKSYEENEEDTNIVMESGTNFLPCLLCSRG